ncbi:pentapeptide repeat-containing protein [Arcobacter cryaerophilus gv. pseudocryaerophilus]
MFNRKKFHNRFIRKKKENDSKRFKITELDLTNSTFEENTKVKIQFCDINKAIFYNTKFKDLADFYQSRFNEVDFERTDFEKISVFSESEFNCDVNFKYTKFLGKAIFRDTIVSGEFDLRNSIFDDEANFLDITAKSRKVYDEKSKDYKFIGEPTDINVANRETARIIKNFYDNSNNIIEANRFYKLEMKERRKEYDSLKRSDYKKVEKLIFILHEYSSNHSQNWFLAFFWIVSITFFYSYLTYDVTSYKDEGSIINKEILNMHYIKKIILSIDYIKEAILEIPNLNILLLSIDFILIIYIMYYKLFTKVKTNHSIIILLLINFYGLYVYLTNDSYLKYFSNSLNPFSIMTGYQELTSLGLVYKTAIAYLIYQLIVSIRQNTRRK